MKKLALMFALPLAMAGAYADGYVISNLNNTPSEAEGWVWEAFADRVMGGKSELVPPVIVEAEGQKALLLAGRVITKGGGFIQVRLRHSKDRFDASAYSGIEIEVDARTPNSWYIFLRTKDNFFPGAITGLSSKQLPSVLSSESPGAALQPKALAKRRSARNT